MSKLVKKPIIISSNVKIVTADQEITISGPKGILTVKIPQAVEVTVKGEEINIQAKNGSKEKNLMGLTRTLIYNATVGVSGGWQKSLELVGTGFRALTDSHELTLHLGFSHPVKITAPENISFQVVDNTIHILGIDKYLVGEIAAQIRRFRPPEPYKGKGIRYLGEVIRKKPGKAAKVVGGTGAK